ncbi:MAG: gliding motility-associated C-terminal domain-containing protein [Saprospiraceae bacterium]
MKKVLAQTAFWGVLTLLFIPSTNATNFSILESQSHHPYHKMDEVWRDGILNMGHQASIIEQSTLDDLANLANTDVLFITSALINISESRLANIEAFVKSGGHLYVQAEYLAFLSGSEVFASLVSKLGGDFTWQGNTNGALIPMEVLNPVDGFLGQVNDLNHFWYGGYGSGDNTIFPFLRLNGQDYGFVFSAMNDSYGKIVTTSDQDWVREEHNADLLASIVNIFTYEIPAVSLTTNLDNPCPNTSVSFQLTSTESLAGLDITWLINGTEVAGAEGLVFETSNWSNGDQVIAKVSSPYFNQALVQYTPPVDILSTTALATVSVEITGPQTAVCESEAVNFTAEVTGTGISNLSYAWLINGQAVVGATSENFQTSDYSDTDVVSCTVTYDEACNQGSTTSSNDIALATIPAAVVTLAIQADELSICQNGTVHFTASGDHLGNNPVYQWLLNGDPVGNNAPSFTASNLMENATVSCLVESSETCVNSASVSATPLSIAVSGEIHPTVAIIPSVWTACEGQEVLFMAIGSDMGMAPSFQWLVDGSPVGTDSDELLLSNLEDGQSVSCVLTVAETCVLINQIEADPVTMQINMTLNPLLSISADVAQTCEGEPVSFTAFFSEAGDNSTLNWLVDGAVVATNQTTFTTTNLAPNQTVTCEMNVNTVCASQDVISSNAISIDVTPQLTASLEIQLSKQKICMGEEVTITAVGEHLGENPVYQWSVNGNTMNSYAATWTTDQLLEDSEITCTVVSTLACVANSAAEATPVTIELSDLVLNILELAPSYCDNQEGLIEVVASGGVAPYTYQWDFSKTGTVLSELAAGTYTVTVADGNGCELVQAIEVENIAEPVIEEVVTTAVACNGVYGSARVFVTDFLAPYTYSWVNEFGVEVGTQPDVFELSAGRYEIIVSSAPGCSVRQEVVVESVVSLEIVTEELVEMKLGEEKELSIFSADPDLSYTWTPATGLSCADCANPIASPLESTTYSVLVSNAEGCVQRLEIFVAVNTEKDVFIPNAFSPNNDGVNDFFTIYGGEKIAKIRSFQVFNRWGASVYKTANFMPNDEQSGWNGQVNNKPLSRGVFVYVFEVEFIDGKTEIFQGDVTLVE